ncbi:transposase [Neobacillus drentensis]
MTRLLKIPLKDNIYKKRGSIIEHLFGTIKRHFGYTYFLTRGLESVNTEVSFICLAYNFKRLISIIGVKELITKFRGGFAPFLYCFVIFIIFVPNILEFIKALINLKTIVRQTHVRFDKGEALREVSLLYLVELTDSLVLKIKCY